ncbi:RING-box protein 2 isoform X6 [Rhineura floridana]|uniref:RING-box protein 2 isoform X6 n=1 Tax=Rhineura floridana TaxID=261503 RepID=UPI002AC83A9F|nr:RING-box protein 2 isoform X6 [Rhineura floridana]
MKRGREQRPHSCGLLSPFPNLNPGLGRGGPGQTSSLLLALRVSLNYTERHLVCTTDACLRCQAENKQEDCVGIIAFGLALRRKCLKCSIGGLGRV